MLGRLYKNSIDGYIDVRSSFSHSCGAYKSKSELFSGLVPSQDPPLGLQIAGHLFFVSLHVWSLCTPLCPNFLLYTDTSNTRLRPTRRISFFNQFPLSRGKYQYSHILRYNVRKDTTQSMTGSESQKEFMLKPSIQFEKKK